MSTSQGKRRISEEEVKSLLRWLEQQSDLESIRTRAAGASCNYYPDEPDPASRIRPPSKLELNQKTSWLTQIWHHIWVPGTSLRGKSYATAEIDRSYLNPVAKLMSIGTLWDFFTTIPIFQFSLASVLGVATVPAAVGLSFFLLLASNFAGEKSTDRAKSHGGMDNSMMSNISLSVFLFLCIVKTLFSGVGIDLWLGSRGIISNYAAELSATKLKEDKLQIERILAGEGNAPYLDVKNKCDETLAAMKALDRNTQEKQYMGYFVDANGTIAQVEADRGLSVDQILKKYGTIPNIRGYCRQKGVYEDLFKIKAAPLQEVYEKKALLIESETSIEYLQVQEKDIFNDHFEIVNEELRFRSGSEAVGQATKQFYDQLFAGKFGLLGFSLFTLVLSAILTGSATVMLYLVSVNPRVKASFTDLATARKNFFTEYGTAIEQYLKSKP